MWLLRLSRLDVRVEVFADIAVRDGRSTRPPQQGPDSRGTMVLTVARWHEAWKGLARLTQDRHISAIGWRREKSHTYTVNDHAMRVSVLPLCVQVACID